MEWLPAALGFGLSQVLLSLVLIALLPRWSTREWLFALLMMAVAVYLVNPLLDLPLSRWVAFLATAVPGLFWLFSASIFTDDFRLQPWQLGLVAYTVLAPVLDYLLDARGVLHLLLLTLPQAVELVLLAMTLWIVLRNAGVDLVESRRRLRWWYVAMNGSYLFMLIVLRESLLELAPGLGYWQYLPVGLILLATNALLLQYKPGALFAELHPAPPGEARVEASEPYNGTDPPSTTSSELGSRISISGLSVPPAVPEMVKLYGSSLASLLSIEMSTDHAVCTRRVVG